MSAEPADNRRTYDVPDRWSLPVLVDLLPSGAVREPTDVEESTAVHLDTAQRDLLTWGARLVRTEHQSDTEHPWELTLPTADGPSVHRAPSAEDDSVPTDLSALIGGLSRGRDLSLLVTLRTDRVRHRWTDEQGATIVQVLDDTVHSSAPGLGAVLATSRRQVTIELGSAGRPRLLRQLGKSLTGAGARRATTDDDLGWALPAPTHGVEPKAGSGKAARAAEDARAYLRIQDAELITQDVRLRTGDDDVHAARVATRRIRSTLRVFAALFDADAVAVLDHELAWYATLLGEVRDRQVQRARFAAAIAELPDELVLGPVAATIEQHLLSEELRATTVLRTAMTGDRYHQLLRLSSGFTDNSPFAPLSRKDRDRDLAAEAVRRADRKALRRLDLALSTGDDELLHRARRAAKRARYAAELSTGHRRRNRKTAKRFKGLQEILGEHQDSMVAADLLRRLASATHDDPTQNGFTFGILHEQESRRADHARREARRWRRS